MKFPDIFRREPQPEISAAESLVEVFEMPKRLGLTTEADKEWLTLCVEARLFRNPLTKTGELLKNPIYEDLRRYRLIDKMLCLLEEDEARHKEQVRETEKELLEYKAEHFPDPQDSERAATILASVNMLVAKGLYNSQDALEDGTPVLRFDSMEEIENWGNFWQPKIGPSRTSIL